VTDLPEYAITRPFLYCGICHRHLPIPLGVGDLAFQAQQVRCQAPKRKLAKISKYGFMNTEI
jgi:hypothetical protein